jgi:hypothetical protein
MERKGSQMTKPLSQEQKEARESERSATKGKSTAKSPVTIETAIADLDKKFDTFIKNVGHGTFSEMVQEVRKLQKDGVFEDRVEAVIQLKLGKEGLKLTMGAKSNVTKKVSHKEDWGSIESNPAQPELPIVAPKDTPQRPVVPPIESGEINPGSFKPSEDPIATEVNNGVEDGEGNPE